MVKIIRNITIDSDIWVKAKQRTDSVSGTINFLLKRWIEIESETYERNKIETMKLELEETKAEMASMEKKMKDIEKERKKEKGKVVKVFE